MCGRYTYFSSEDVIKQYDLLPEPELQLALDFPDSYNVAPGAHMPVIIRGKQGHYMTFMEWGLIPAWSKDPKPKLKLINARKEGLLEKPMWKRLVKDQRCVVPATGFYEWKKLADRKQPYFIKPKEDLVFSFAGLWDEWTNEKGQRVRTYTIITTTPNNQMAEIHNRMPAILNKEQVDIWLNPLDVNQDILDDILKPAPDNSLEVIMVSTAVNNVKNNKESLIYPLVEEN